MASSGPRYYSKKSQCECVTKVSNSGEIIQTKCFQSSETFQTSRMSEVKFKSMSETVKTVKTPAGMHSAKLKNSSTQAIKPPPAVKQQSSTRAIKAPAVKLDEKRKSSTQVVKSPAKR